MPTRPEQTLLLIVGPDTSRGFNTAESDQAVQTLRTLGYHTLHATDLTIGARAMPAVDGVARAEHWYESHDASLLVDAAEALNMPVLGVDAWARAIGPDARAWYPELFDGMVKL